MSVNQRLARKRAKVVRDIPDYAGMVRRVIRAHGRRVGDADPEDLIELLELRAVIEDSIRDAVRGQRRAGFSWAEIARPLGMSRQAVQQRYGVTEEEALREIRAAQDAYRSEVARCGGLDA